jgi:hypothetical protein
VDTGGYASGEPETVLAATPPRGRFRGFRGTDVPASHDPLGRLPCLCMSPEDDDKNETIKVSKQRQAAKHEQEQQEAEQKRLLQEADQKRREREQREKGDS